MSGHYPKVRHGFSDWAAGVDGAAVAVPLTIGSAFVLYSSVAPGWMGAGIFASCLALVLVHVCNMAAHRPLAYSGRFFEAVTLATVIQALVPHFEHWGLADTPGVRVALLIVVSTMAALSMGLLWLVGAERMVRFIPAPVFTAYTNSAALAVIGGQLKSLLQQMHGSEVPLWLLFLALVTLGVSLLFYFWRAHWPAAALGLTAGALTGGALMHWAGLPLETLDAGRDLAMPWALADFASVRDALWSHPTLLANLLPYAALLGVLLFLNSVVTGVIVAQVDGRLRFSRCDKWVQVLSLLLPGLIGATPISAASNVSKAVLRKSPMSQHVFVVLALVVVAFWGSGLLALLPLVALIGTFFFDAWLLLSREYFESAWAWLRRKSLPRHVQEDLLLITAVMLGYMTINIMAAMFIGLLLGLLLHAARNTRTPIRHSFTGAQSRSNCARSPQEYAVLQAHGDQIKIFQLDSNQFFASAEALQMHLRDKSTDAKVVVVDWSAVHDIDSSIGLVMGNLRESFAQRDVRMLHAGAALHGAHVKDILRENDPEAEFCDDLDWALETAENHVISAYIDRQVVERPIDPAQASLLAKLSAQDQAVLIQQMAWLDYAPGDVLIRRGDASDCLLVLLQGQASVVVSTPSQAAFRLAGVRSGSLIGEMGFLDRRERSATVVAETAVKIGSLSRAAYEALQRTHPHIAHQLVVNISLDLANRLRNTNAQAAASRSDSALG